MSTTKSDILVGEGLVLLELHETGLAHIRLNSPKNSNALETSLLKSFHDVLMRCHGESRIRAVLLTGEGKNFCGGGDVREFFSKGDGRSAYIRQATSYLQIVANALIDLQAPVVTAVQGFAAGGGGLGLVCCSDLVLCGESTKFMGGVTRVAMAPDAGLSVMLGRIIGFRRAMEMLLTSSVLDAQTALTVGLVNRVVPDGELLAKATALGQELASGAPLAQAATKRLLWRGIGLAVEAGMPEESRTVAELAGTADCHEGLAAVIERRAPQFKGR